MADPASTTPNYPTKHQGLIRWVQEAADLCQPNSIVWCDGSLAEKERLESEAVQTGELIKLDTEKHPGSFLHRSAHNDVARVEELTFICSERKEDAGPTNNWMDPREAYQKLGKIFEGAMRGRTLYVVPFVMGIPGSIFSKVGVEITDSRYVVLNMRIMTRMGSIALEELGEKGEFVKCFHSKADLSLEKRFICHFPQDNTVWSVGSGYGGNALLGKKCMALRLGSAQGKKEGWLAEHMLILGIEDPTGKIQYVAAAFPSRCGKTNLAMMRTPEFLAQKGYRVWTVGDDIAWLRIGEDGRLWAVNPEAGYFGVAPGTSPKSNPNALAACSKNTIFTNVLLKKDNTVWWEGLEEAPSEGIDWKGEPWTPAKGTLGAHPNSRFTSPALQCPSYSPEANNPKGVPISAIIFGGRWSSTQPLVIESFDWAHGVYLASTLASETTAAASGKVGVLRRDPMAMLPFCGYHMGDYFGHWLEMGKKLSAPPKIFYVNWFRAGKDGKYLWPGYGENMRVLLWMLDRCQGTVKTVPTPIGCLPEKESLDLSGMDLSAETVAELFRVDTAEWKAEAASRKQFLETFGERLPREIREQNENLIKRLEK